MKNVNEIKTALISFLEGDVTILDNGTLSGSNGVAFKAIDNSRDGIETTVFVEYYDNGSYSVDMIINETFRDIGGFEL